LLLYRTLQIKESPHGLFFLSPFVGDSWGSIASRGSYLIYLREDVLRNLDKDSKESFFLSHCMIDQFAEHYFIAKSYGLVQEFVDTYRFFRRQGVARPFAAYYAAKEWDL